MKRTEGIEVMIARIRSRRNLGKPTWKLWLELVCRGRHVVGVLRLLWITRGWSDKVKYRIWNIRSPRMIPTLIRLLRSEWKDAAQQALSEMRHPKAVEPLLSLLPHGDSNYLSRIKVDPHLSRLNVDPVEIVEALGNIRDLRAVEPLIDALEAPAWDLRRSAAFALGNIGDPRAVPYLVKRLANDTHSWVKEAAAFALTALGETAIPSLIDALKNRDSRTVGLAIKALGDLRTRRAVSPIIEALKTAGRDVSLLAIRALGKIGDQGATTALIKCLTSDDRELSNAAVYALGEIGAPSAHDTVYALLAYMRRLLTENYHYSWELSAIESALSALGHHLEDNNVACPDCGGKGATWLEPETEEDASWRRWLSDDQHPRSMGGFSKCGRCEGKGIVRDWGLTLEQLNARVSKGGGPA